MSLVPLKTKIPPKTGTKVRLKPSIPKVGY